MGYGTGKKDTPGVHGLQKAGKMQGGGVKLDKQPPGKISEMQGSVLEGEQTRKENDAMGSAKIISGGHSKGKFMGSPKYKSHGTSKANYDKDMAEERIQIKDDKQKIYQDDKEKRDSSPTKLKGDQVKLDKNKNGRIDGGDFKMMQK